MKKFTFKIIIGLFITIGLSLNLSADIANAKSIDIDKIHKMDERMTSKRTKNRNFRNQKEFQRVNKNRRLKQERKNYRDEYSNKNSYNNRHYNDNSYYKREYPIHKQRSYHNLKRGWYLAYRYDRATFNDRYGYHYGYFNTHGYYFEGIFYRYDRDYSYRDRVVGKGLFGNKYYMPSNYKYYGFSTPRPSRSYR